MGKNCGKFFGRFNFINGLAKYWEREGHEVINLAIGDIYKVMQPYDFQACIKEKKPINLKMVEYEFDPDFIFIEQIYLRYDISDLEVPVIYQHREYTHFPDVLIPNILLGSYPYRLRSFEIYHPYEYSQIPYRDFNYMAVDPEYHEAKEEKELKGIYHIGLAIEAWQFAEPNGVFCEMTLDEMGCFARECIDKGYCEGIGVGMQSAEFHTFLSRCEAILIDNGKLNTINRRIFESMASKTLCVIRIYDKRQEALYEKIGLTDEMCYFIHTPDDIKTILEEWNADESIARVTRIAKTQRAYEWVIKNHTYEIRAKEVLEKFEEWKRGVKKEPLFMGYHIHSGVSSDGSGGVVSDN